MNPGNRHLFRGVGGAAVARGDGPSDAPKVVQSGAVTSEARAEPWGKSWERPLFDTDLPAYKGSSGSPVFDARTHRAVGISVQVAPPMPLERAAPPGWSFRTLVVPTRDVVAWIGDKVQAGAVPEDLAGRLRAILDAAR